MTDTTDLVRRLREAEKSDDGVSPFNFDSVLMKEAADAIERLSAPAPEYKEENVKAAPAEPVAWMFWNDPDTQRHFSQVREKIGSYWTRVVPLYAHPAAPAPEYKEENVKAEPAPDAMRELLWRVVSGQEVPMAEIHAVLTATAAPAPDAAIDAALYAYLKGEKG